ncbi:MAG: AcvB/VirJ family lysyl-phosphatidylglycerol hydrolase [Thermodesulfobacteriota bacterium]
MNGKTLWLLALALFLHGGLAAGDEQRLQFGNFGTITVYRASPRPAHVVLFVSGDGGWNLGVVDMARELATLDALVVGIDITHYLAEIGGKGESCSYPAADFEGLSKFVQKKFDFPRYVVPVLVGYSSGATLVYATVVQAPPNTFLGAISMGFCPDLSLTKPLCRGNGLEWSAGKKDKGYSFLPASNLQTPWIALQGTIDQVCNAAANEAYVHQVNRGQIVMLPHVGHGFSVPRNWMPQFKEAFGRLAGQERGASDTPTSGLLKDLPLVEIPAAMDLGASPLAVMISGDGGWAGLDREVANVLAARGVPVVGINSLQYFWTPRTPEGAAKDLERVLRHYLPRWKKEEAILIGYSLGADVLPFMANRLPEDLLAKVSLVALVGLGHSVDFEFHVTEWLHASAGKKALPILPEVKKLSGKKVLCVYGEQEKDTLCRELDIKLATAVSIPGAHHFGGDYGAIAEAILKAWRGNPSSEDLPVQQGEEARKKAKLKRPLSKGVPW